MKRKSSLRIFAGIIILVALLVAGVTYGSLLGKTQGKVHVSEQTITIPTYLVDPPSVLPRFYEGRAHQGVQRRMYPYPMNDNMTGKKEDRDYNIIYLENEYIKVGIMPDLGGRIYSAVDKTNGYNYFYRNDVIKPSLIGMVGFWISGGNAWGYPHHHGPHTVEAMDHTIEHGDDGRVTLWISYTERMHRLRMLCGYTLYPNSSVIDMVIRPFNPTPYVHSFLFWANPSVHTDTTYQVIFPPSVEYVTQHHKNEMTTWPIADRYYNRFDYTGKDISMWKNTGVPSSFFSWKPQEDFFGGYDHGKQAGTAWIGNHHTMPGMKFWADGNNPAGVRFNSALTDDSGQYIELMAGAFTDNQPDYSWIQPYEGKDVVMTWFPIRLLGGLIEANRNAALNMVAGSSGGVDLMLNTTRLYEKATVSLLHDGTEVLREVITISPSLPYTKTITLSGDVQKENLLLSLTDREGNIVITHQPKPAPGNTMPQPLKSPPAPEEVKSVEELYLHGLRLDQFHNASISSYPYYEEALRRDPGDYRVNTQLGQLYAKRKMFEEAEQHLQTAVDRITMRYTRSKDSEAQYYLGVVKRQLGKDKEAYDLFYDASWNTAWYGPAFHQLAELDCKKGDFEKALEHIDRAISANSLNVKAMALRATILRKLGRLDEAFAYAEHLVAKDRLLCQPRNETYLVSAQRHRGTNANEYLHELSTIMNDRVQTYLEFATDYSNCGLYGEAIDILTRLEAKGEQYPELWYHLGYYHSLKGEKEKAATYFKEASLKPHDRCFPFRDESFAAFNEALTYYPDDAMIYYYLGTMLYEQQPEKAVALWEKSAELNPGFYITQRNLAWAAQQNNELNKAVQYYRDAFAANHSENRLLYEYDQACERAGISPEVRYADIYKGNRQTVKKQSATFLRELGLLNNLGQYDEVIQLLTTEDFIESEGSQVLRDIYHNSYIFRSLRQAAAGNYEMAIKDMQAALDFPIGRWGSERRAQMNYLMGTYYEQWGDKEIAQEHFRKAADELADGTEFLYEKALACRKLGRNDECRKHLNALLEMANRRSENDAFRSFEGADASRQARSAYLKGLAYKGMGRHAEAKGEFTQALKLNPAYIQASVMINY
jgi:tetratricopeptide (TPR) repeat protein